MIIHNRQTIGHGVYAKAGCCSLVSHIIMGVNKGIGAFGLCDIINGIGVFSEVLEAYAEYQILLTSWIAWMGRRTVSLNLDPSPKDRGHIRSMRKVTRKKLIFSWSTKMSIVL